MDDNERTILQFPPPSPGYVASTLPFFVVGMGASAGGIEALLRFFEALPSNNGMAFVIVLHLSPKHESNIAHILQQKTAMPVVQVSETVSIEPNHVYVISPRNDLLMNDGMLQVVSAARPRGRHVVIDGFFRTLAEVHRERSVGIVLSGTGSDGAVGIARVKETGGMTFAQAPDDAEQDSMPRCAIQTGTVDFVLPVVEMPQKLIDLFQNARSLTLPSAGNPDQPVGADDDDQKAQAEEYALREILHILHAQTGNDFNHYKRATVLRRIERRLQVNGLPNVIAYRDHLRESEDEVAELLQDMLISVTNFFRDREAFEALERNIIPKIFEELKTGQIRAWSLGCATGEEAYSLAMLLADQNDAAGAERAIQVFASDIDERAVNFGRRAFYPDAIVTDVTPSRLRLYFDKENDRYCIKREIRERVLFAVHNVLRDPPFSRLDLIVCRNLLIYLNRDVQNKIFEMLHYALQPNGYLFLGTAESADGVPELFRPIDKKNRIYQAINIRQSAFNAIPPALLTSNKTPIVKSAKAQPDRSHITPRDVSRQFLEDHSPAGILIDQSQNVLYTTGKANRFLHHPGGEPTRDILSMVHPDLQLELRAALFQAGRLHELVETRYLPVREGDKTSSIRIIVRPAQNQYAGTGMTFLSFEEASNPDQRVTTSAKVTDNTVVRHLESELMQTKEQLRSLVEQYETTLEDVKSANEELQSSNEELRSTAEELETSKEELQSINEELSTVNYELKRRVEETGKANDDLQNFLSSTDIGTIFIDRGMHIKRYSKPSVRLFKLIAADIDRSILDINCRLDYPELSEDIATVFDTLQPYEREVMSPDDGAWYIARLRPYRTAEDKIDGLVLSFIEITGRKDAEESLRLSEQRLRLITASTRDYAIATLDMEGVVTSWNSEAARVFGYTEAEIIGQSAAVLFTPEDMASGALEDELRRARKDGRAEGDRWYLRKDGSRVFCSGSAAPLLDDKLCGYVKIVRDQTESKRVREQQDADYAREKEERIRAEEAARVRDEFFAVLSHELKQPLNLIQLSAEMMSRLPEPVNRSSIARGTATIKRMVEGQARIIDDLMDLSRLHTGKLTLSYTQLNFSERVSHVVHLMMAEAQQKDITLDLEGGPEDLIVQGDVVRIEQIVWNLLSNALKFTPAGGQVRVELSAEADSACMTVSDSGRGIAPEFLPFIFDMFRQANSGTARQHGGMGIGLALVKELVQSHGGRVEVASNGEGQGAQFRVALPLAHIPRAVQSLQGEPMNSLTGKRVLLVEDTVETLEVLQELLRSEGAMVTPAASGAVALQIVEASPEAYDLIISDIGMPGMDGFQLLVELRKRQATASTPAIALSGFTRPADVHRALDAGFATHVRKPVVFDQFLTTVGRISN